MLTVIVALAITVTSQERGMMLFFVIGWLGREVKGEHPPKEIIHTVASLVSPTLMDIWI